MRKSDVLVFMSETCFTLGSQFRRDLVGAHAHVRHLGEREEAEARGDGEDQNEREEDLRRDPQVTEPFHKKPPSGRRAKRSPS
jgi:hypothetical protein